MTQTFVRHVYMYRWKLNNRPFYVGSTENLKRRHQNRLGYVQHGYSDSIIRDFSSKSLILEIIDEVEGLNKAEVRKKSYLLENKYIIQYKTLVEEGGGNRSLNAVKNLEKYESVAGHVSPSTLKSLRLLAETKNCTVSALVRLSIEQFLASNLLQFKCQTNSQ